MDQDRKIVAKAKIQLQRIAQYLNADYESWDLEALGGLSSVTWYESYQSALRPLVDSWIDAGNDFLNWSEQNPDLRQGLDDFTSTFRFRLVSESNGSARLQVSIVGEERNPEEHRALTDFLTIIRSPLFDRLGKCKKCTQYYLAGSKHETKYCSRRCATGATARQSTTKRLQREREEKIRRAERAIEQFKARKPKADWKTWVSQHAGLTRKWLTQAYNRGELRSAKRLVERTKER